MYLRRRLSWDPLALLEDPHVVNRRHPARIEQLPDPEFRKQRLAGRGKRVDALIPIVRRCGSMRYRCCKGNTLTGRRANQRDASAARAKASAAAEPIAPRPTTATS
jgi:hypothetical protein